MIVYDGLFALLKEQGHSLRWLRRNGISQSVYGKLAHGGGLDHRTINKLCALLDCQPGDLMAYVPDPPAPADD